LTFWHYLCKNAGIGLVFKKYTIILTKKHLKSNFFIKNKIPWAKIIPYLACEKINPWATLRLSLAYNFKKKLEFYFLVM